MNKTIFIDPGHGGRDWGAVGINGRRESDDNLRMCLALRPHLQRQGFGVVMSRETDVFVELGERVRMAHTANADLFISLHRNGWHTPDAHGTEIVVHAFPTTSEVALANDMLDELRLVGVQRIRGVLQKNFHVLRETRMTAVMPELGFVSNMRDNQLFDQHLDGYAQAIARSVCSYFGVAYIPPGETAPAPPRQLARIQLGAFTWPDDEAGARAALAQIRAIPGLGDAWLVIPEAQGGDD